MYLIPSPSGYIFCTSSLEKVVERRERSRRGRSLGVTILHRGCKATEASWVDRPDKDVIISLNCICSGQTQIRLAK